MKIYHVKFELAILNFEAEFCMCMATFSAMLILVHGQVVFFICLFRLEPVYRGDHGCTHDIRVFV